MFDWNCVICDYYLWSDLDCIPICSTCMNLLEDSVPGGWA